MLYKEKFNKKWAFTLAEVLITLAIIGVVSALTVPTVIKSTQEQQARAKVKKNFSVLSRALILRAELSTPAHSQSSYPPDSEQAMYLLLLLSYRR